MVHPGDKLPIRGIDVTVIAAGTQLLEKPLPGAGRPNPACASAAQEAEILEDLEDNMSIGLLVTFGRFRMVDLADLEAHYQYKLMCPNNPIGPVDVYHVSVHGQDKGISPALDHAVGARVALMGNGSPGPGGHLDVTLSEGNRKRDNPPEDFIADILDSFRRSASPNLFEAVSIWLLARTSPEGRCQHRRLRRRLRRGSGRTR